MTNPVPKAILATIHAAGFTVTVSAGSVSATNQDTSERFIVNYDDNFYDAVVELSQQVGIDLEDG